MIFDDSLCEDICLYEVWTHALSYITLCKGGGYAHKKKTSHTTFVRKAFDNLRMSPRNIWLLLVIAIHYCQVVKEIFHSHITGSVNFTVFSLKNINVETRVMINRRHLPSDITFFTCNKRQEFKSFIVKQTFQ